MAEVLTDLGVVVDHPAPGVYEVAAGDVDWLFVPLEAAAKMRASFILLGPLLARFGRVIISNPGGDRIGRRPVNLHVDAMRALGAEIEYRNGYYYAQAPGRLRGGEVTFPQVTVMGTENAMLAATPRGGRHHHPPGGPGAGGRRPDRLPARDGRGRRPDGARRHRGARPQAAARGQPLRGPGPDRDRDVPGGGGRHRRQAHAGERGLRPRRRAGRGVRPGRRARGVRDRTRSRSTPRACAPADLRARDIETAPYPGLATDVQPPMCVLLTQATGTSRVHEAIFEDRLEWLAELRKLGARIDIEDAAPRVHPRARPAPRRRGDDRRPAGRRLAHPRRPRGRWRLADPRRASRSPGV